jgi:AAA15 family ATPase/GTPase
MYRNVQITQEMLSEFCENVHIDLIKLKEDSKLKNEMIQKLNDQINALTLQIETSKIVTSEKNENIIFRMSVLNEKMLIIEQKMNDLNKIMMKHFAYKSQNKGTTEPKVTPTSVPSAVPSNQFFKVN